MKKVKPVTKEDRRKIRNQMLNVSAWMYYLAGKRK